MSEKPYTSADGVVSLFLAEDVEYVFGLPGSQILEVVDGVERSDEIQFVGTHHEQGAAFMAEGYARARRGPGICLSTVGPGATNLVTGVASSFKGYVPVLALTGKHARWQQDRNTFQEIDQKALFEPITRYSQIAAEPEDLPKITQKAFRLMCSSPRGPAHLNLPKDTQTGEIDEQTLPREAYHPEGTTKPPEDAIQRIVDQLDAADNPVLLAGYDVVWEDAGSELASLAESIEAPVVTSCFHLDAFPTIHELGMGAIGPGFWESANTVIAEADLVVAVGAHFDFLSTHFGDDIIPTDADKIQIHTDPSNVGAVFPLEIGISCHITPFLNMAVARSTDVNTAWSRDELASIKEGWEAVRANDIDLNAAPPHPATVVNVIREATPKETRFTIDGGNFQKHVIRQLDTYETNTYISNANFGTVGSGFPLSLGAAYGTDHPVVCLTGDGGIGLNIQELETAARENIPVTVVVFNDYGMGNVRSYQKYVYEERFTGVDFPEQDFVSIADGFGVPGSRVRDASDIKPAVTDGLAHEGPYVLDVEIDAGALEKPVFLQD